MIHGEAKTGKAWIGNQEIDINRSLRLINKSPTGFSWGYHGSGPGQLALAILLELTDEQAALNFYQLFKQEVIAQLPAHEDFSLPVAQVLGWINARKTEHCHDEN